MTRFKGLLAAAAAAAMLTGSTGAAANPAASLSVAARAGTPSVHGAQLGASVPRGTLISIGILAVLVVVVLVATKGSSSGSPKSP